MNEKYLLLEIRYQSGVFACSFPKGMICETDSFEGFFYMVKLGLIHPGNNGRRFRLPERERTWLENIEYESIERVVETHNGRIGDSS